jgi:hypothetical protein
MGSLLWIRIFHRILGKDPVDVQLCFRDISPFYPSFYSLIQGYFSENIIIGFYETLYLTILLKNPLLKENDLHLYHTL